VRDDGLGGDGREVAVDRRDSSDRVARLRAELLEKRLGGDLEVAGVALDVALDVCRTRQVVVSALFEGVDQPGTDLRSFDDIRELFALATSLS